MKERMAVTGIVVTLLKSKRLNSKSIIILNHYCAVTDHDTTLKTRLKTRLTNDNCNETVNELLKRFEYGNVIKVGIYDSYYNSKLSFKRFTMDNDTILAIRGAYAAANGLAAHIESLLK